MPQTPCSRAPLPPQQIQSQQSAGKTNIVGSTLTTSQQFESLWTVEHADPMMQWAAERNKVRALQVTSRPQQNPVKLLKPQAQALEVQESSCKPLSAEHICGEDCGTLAACRLCTLLPDQTTRMSLHEGGMLLQEGAACPADCRPGRRVRQLECDACPTDCGTCH